MRVIAGTARSIPLKSRDGLQTRPTTDRVKVSMFNIIQFEIEIEDIVPSRYVGVGHEQKAPADRQRSRRLVAEAHSRADFIALVHDVARRAHDLLDTKLAIPTIVPSEVFGTERPGLLIVVAGRTAAGGGRRDLRRAREERSGGQDQCCRFRYHLTGEILRIHETGSFGSNSYFASVVGPQLFPPSPYWRTSRLSSTSAWRTSGEWKRLSPPR